MNVCESCGREIEKDAEFILYGKYPGARSVWLHSTLMRWAPPETYGKIYHKACFLRMLKETNTSEKGVRP